MKRPLARAVSLALGALLASVSYAAPPANLDVSPGRATDDGRYVVTLQPPSAPPAIGQFHAWTIHVVTPGGAPVRQAHIAVDGGMPQHGHGLPTQPRVTRALADGSYVVEGMKFSMPGSWEIRLSIEAPEGRDRVTFNTVIADPPVR